MIAGTIETTDILNKEGFLITMDVEKALDSLDHSFVISVLKIIDFGNYFISWIVIYVGNTTQYFRFERGIRQGILALEESSVLVRNNKDIKGR